MKLKLCSILMAASFNASAVDFYFDRVPITDFIRTIYTDVLKRNYTLDNEALLSTQVVTVDWKNIDPNSLDFLTSDLLHSYGFRTSNTNNVLHITKLPIDDQNELFVYKPKNRSVQYLQSAILKVLRLQNTGFTGGAVGGVNTATSSANSALNNVDAVQLDTLAIEVPKLKFQSVKDLVAALDHPNKQIDFKAVIYEFQTDERKSLGFGITLAKRLLGTMATISVLPSGFLGSALSIKGASIDLVIEALNNNDNFKLVSTPSVRVGHGDTAYLNVGASVPVLGQITRDQQGNPFQAVDYKNSGVTLDLKPMVYDNNIELDIKQSISNFVPTTNGVNQSPTLLNRSINTKLSANEKELILIGGLQQNRSTNNHSSLPFFNIKTSNSDQSQNSEYLIFIEVSKAI